MNLDDLVRDPVPRPNLQWSHFQTDIFDAVANSSDNLIIEAVAGSGKTTTIVEAIHHTQGEVLFLAFNKKIVSDLQAKLPPHVECRTFNSLGASLLRKACPKSRLSFNKNRDLVKPHLSSIEMRNWGSAIADAISFFKNLAHFDPPSTRHLLEYLENTSVPVDCFERASNIFYEAWIKSIEILSTHSFDDQLYYPIHADLQFPAYSTVFVDEAQDLNPIQHEMLLRLADQGARIIAVGDTYQGIYAFRGAYLDSMSRLQASFSMMELPLSVCYRCPKKVIDTVRSALPKLDHIAPREDAPEGTVEFMGGLPPLPEISADAMIMCRFNAPLMKLALQFLRERIPCRLSNSRAQSLVYFIKSFTAVSAADYKKQLTHWYFSEYDKAVAHNRTSKLEWLKDRYESIIPFCDEFDTKDQIIKAIEKLITSETGTTLCTIHAAKGLEANDAYLYGYEWFTDERLYNQAQEANLYYVAMTRAKSKLTFVMDNHGQ